MNFFTPNRPRPESPLSMGGDLEFVILIFLRGYITIINVHFVQETPENQNATTFRTEPEFGKI